MSTSLPETYRAAFVVAKDAPFEIREVKLKMPGPGEVLVKTLASGVCGSDSEVVTQKTPIPLPQVIGHELCGNVVAAGEGEQKWEVGDLVGNGWHGGHDGTCDRCRKGDFNTCENEQIMGMTMPGSHAEYVLCRSEALAAMPKDMDPVEAAPLLCAGVTTFNSLRYMTLMPGDVVAIQGIGGLGHLAIQFATKMGYKTVALSGSDSKKKLAEQLGAHVYVDGSKKDQAEALKEMGGAKVIACTAPNSEVINKLIGGLAVEGQLLILALAEEDLKIPVTPLVTKRLSVKGWPVGTPIDEEETVAFAQLQNIKPLVETYTLGEINEAYQRMKSGKARFRCVIKFD
ncbi:hypothetical protein JCM8547_005813 [Rhodosporidiobolus lusitaniae]